MHLKKTHSTYTEYMKLTQYTVFVNTVPNVNRIISFSSHLFSPSQTTLVSRHEV